MLPPSMPSPWIKSLGLFGLIVSDLVIFVGLGLGTTYFAYSRWAFPWWVILIGVVLGLTISMLRMVQYVKRNEE